MKLIWCLFSIDNDYNQPENNLVVWWETKPSFEILMAAMSVSLSGPTEGLVAVANVLQGKNERWHDTDYRLEHVPVGKVQ